MERSAMEGITNRLASIEGLYFPGAIHRQTPEPSQRKSTLLDLLSRDASIFLGLVSPSPLFPNPPKPWNSHTRLFPVAERYGLELTADELREFEVLKADYEVEWHLNRLRRGRSPTAEEARERSVTVKNRRRAYMELLIRGGEYFSEDSMREREPYLHHEYLGRFQDPFGRVLSRPGERWSETLLRRCEEAMLVEKIRREQQRLGVARRDWVGSGGEEEQEEEEEGDEDESEQVKGEEKCGSSESRMHVDREPGCSVQDGSIEPFEQTLSAEEMQDHLEQFTHIMQQKFLAGEDTEHLDYSKIDNDERLDDHWLREANYDAEEKYFEED
ncbi:coiled-coil domain-containing protein 97 [Cocos nucifera]|uniref:Coiled-coil domain-containing protein 97 n=1 Tax=Cocos nucifera TaxID=13894 RepID=A0A8K0N690_COCNU|nr:coiled-coil domain-containing protein 97 [Cocos nucifera]